ncbi:MAG: apolipoprotein N-acyltransferase [Pirellulales bacterium]|nr:apolipoprotein N-acyltransferase [Pirellulales bacterium]
MRHFITSTFGLALIGAVIVWASLPPLGLWPLAWIGPAFWAYLARQKNLQGRHPYLALWVVGFIYWTAIFYFLVFPHWATSFGLLALSFYQAFYLPIFIGLVRVAVHRLRVSVVLASPVVLVGLELARAHLITGVTMGNLGHSQYRWIELIQVSDLAGAYAVSFVVMLVAASLARAMPYNNKSWTIIPLFPAAAVMAATLIYGHLRVYSDDELDSRPFDARVALIQGSIDSELKHDPKRQQKIQQQYVKLSKEAVNSYGSSTVPGGLDLIVWPETMFRSGLFTYDESASVPPSWKELQDRFKESLEENAISSREPVCELAKELGVPMIVGIDSSNCIGGIQVGGDSLKYDVENFNSAVFVSAAGKILGQYNKMHRVIFGEYVPFADHFPWLQRLTPLPGSLTAGKSAVSFDVNGLRYSPSICYENVLPHVIRRQVNGVGQVDVLVNLTNDGWFKGSNELDLHLICAVFRAVECRKPFIIAANTGFSASIDGDGRILAQGPRRDTEVVFTEIRRDGRLSWYLMYGDWPAGVCLMACLMFAVVGIRARIVQRKGKKSAHENG